MEKKIYSFGIYTNAHTYTSSLKIYFSFSFDMFQSFLMSLFILTSKISKTYRDDCIVYIRDFDKLSMSMVDWSLAKLNSNKDQLPQKIVAHVKRCQK